MKNTKSNRMNATERKQKRVNENEREEIIKDDSKSLTILCMSSVSMQHPRTWTYIARKAEDQSESAMDITDLTKTIMGVTFGFLYKLVEACRRFLSTQRRFLI